MSPQLTIHPNIDKADHEAQYTTDEENDGVLHDAVVFDVYHDQFDDADYSKDMLFLQNNREWNILGLLALYRYNMV